MNTEFFIARRIAFQGQKSFSKIIVRIAILAIALGLAVMIVSMSIITGFNQKISEKIFGFWGHIHVTDIHITRSYDYQAIEYSSSLVDSIMGIEGIEPVDNDGLRSQYQNRDLISNGGIRQVHSFAFLPGIIQSKSELEGIMLKGINRDFDWKQLEEFIIKGDSIVWNDSIASRSIIVSQRTSQRLKVDVGDKLIVQFVQGRDTKKRAFTIAGIYKTGLEEYDVKFAMCDIRVLQDLLDWEPNEVAGYEIFLDNVDDMDLYADYIYAEMLPRNQFAETIKDKFPNIFDWLDLQKINEYIILFLMILVSVINMTTVILIIILERSRMIGVLKALGYNHWSIRKIFVYLAFWITGFGVFLGNVLGLGFCFLQDKFEFIKLDEVNYYVATAPIQIEFWPILLLNIGTILIIVFFMLLPSYLVSHIKPVKVLRFD